MTPCKCPGPVCDPGLISGIETCARTWWLEEQAKGHNDGCIGERLKRYQAGEDPETGIFKVPPGGGCWYCVNHPISFTAGGVESFAVNKNHRVFVVDEDPVVFTEEEDTGIRPIEEGHWSIAKGSSGTYVQWSHTDEPGQSAGPMPEEYAQKFLELVCWVEKTRRSAKPTRRLWMDTDCVLKGDVSDLVAPALRFENSNTIFDKHGRLSSSTDKSTVAAGGPYPLRGVTKGRWCSKHPKAACVCKECFIATAADCFADDLTRWTLIAAGVAAVLLAGAFSLGIWIG